MIFNLGPAVLQLSSHTVNVTRYARDGYDVNGRATPRTVDEVFTISGSVQPVSGRDLNRLPDGFDASEWISVWTPSKLQARDVLTVAGRGDFEVEFLGDWEAHGGYYKAIAKLRAESEPRPPEVPELPAGAMFVLKASEVAGVNGDLIGTWENVAGNAFPDFTQINNNLHPNLLANSNEHALQFDGVFDLLTAPATAAATGFIHSTGVFDLVLCFRATNTNIGVERRICGNAEGQAGLAVLLNNDGNIWVILGNGVASVVNFVTTVPAPLGEPVKILIRGDGTRIRISRDFSTFQDQAFGAALIAGPAFYDFSIGGANPSQTTPRTFEGDFYAAALYERNLNASELADAQAFLEYQVGAGV